MRWPITWVFFCAAAVACADLTDALIDGFERPPKVEIKKSVGIRVEPVEGARPAPMAKLLGAIGGGGARHPARAGVDPALPETASMC